MQQLIDSKSYVDINQGMDIRLMTEEKADMVSKLKIKEVHFAWDKYEDKNIIVPKFKYFKKASGWDIRKMRVFCLTNFDTTIEQDLDRIYTLRDMGYDPYVMIYNKELTDSKDTVRRLQRWVNNKFIFRSTERFEEYKP